MGKMKIEIWSDIACPYCYIGKRKLDNALKQLDKNEQIDLVWHSYELTPDLPKKTEKEHDYLQFLIKEEGLSEQEIIKGQKELKELAESVGLTYHFEKVIAANTGDALRLVKFAAQKSRASEVLDLLFKAYFAEGKDVSDRATLLELGSKAGLGTQETRQFLDSDQYIDELTKDIRYSEDILQLEYIPFYVFNNKHIIQGSVSEEDYLDVLKKAFADWEQNGVGEAPILDTSIQGKACSIDGKCD